MMCSALHAGGEAKSSKGRLGQVCHPHTSTNCKCSGARPFNTLQCSVTDLQRFLLPCFYPWFLPLSFYQCAYVRTYVPLSCSTSLCCCRSVQLQPKLADSYWQRHLLSLIQGNTQVHTLCTLVHVSVCTLFAGLRTYVRTYTLALYVRTSTTVSCSSIVYSLHCVSVPDICDHCTTYNTYLHM